MIYSILATISSLTILFSGQPVVQDNKVLAQANYSLENRYSNSYVNDVFVDNILLTLAYMSGKVKKGDIVAWNVVREDGEAEFILKPGETFAFHDAVSDKYKNKIAVTMNSHFNAGEGFKSDGWLVGDGVCHLASFIYVAAKNAGLEVEAPTSHDFAVIPNIEKKDGVSIFSENSLQNLYITNNQNEDIIFVIVYKDNSLTIRVETANMNK